MIGNYTDLGFFASVETPSRRSATVPQDASDQEVNRNVSNLAANSRQLVPSINDTGTIHGIMSAKGCNSITSAAETPC